MRTIKYLLASVIVLLTACNAEDFVTLENTNLITSGYFWKTANDAYLGTNACYQALYLDGTYKRKYEWTMDVRADDTYNTTPYGYCMSALTTYTISPSEEEIDQLWECNYVQVWRANQLLDNIENIEMNAELKERYKGEAKFLRGLAYFNLLNLFQNVVLHLHTPQSVNDFYKEQSPPEVVWEQVYADFTDAIAGCWNKGETRSIDGTSVTNEVGRATKAAAASMLAKSYLMNKRFSDAQPLLKDIIDGAYGPYSLVSNYGAQFKGTDENNAESIFEIQFDANFGTTNGWVGDPQSDWAKTDGYHKGLAPQGPPSCWGDICPSLYLFNEFQKEKTVDGKIDPRMEASLIWYHADSPSYTVYTLPQDRISEFGYATTGRTDLGITEDYKVFAKKFVYEDLVLDAAWLSGINRPLIRYADILLLYAECLNEANQTAAAYPYIQQVRDRANLPDLATTKPGMTQVQMREQLDHERLLELNLETWRYLDLLRWGYFDSQASVDAILSVRDPEFKNWIPGREYLAIPPTEIDRTKGFVKQNPAWN
jgi:hypothetical protein